MSKSVNWSEAYRRRIERGIAKGLSRSAARGHPKPHERPSSPPSQDIDARMLSALYRVRAGDALTPIAKEFRVSRERLRRFVGEYGDYRRVGGRYRFIERKWYRLPLYSDGRTIEVEVDAPNATKLGAFMAAVKAFLKSNDRSHIEPFIGGEIVDVRGRRHPFETDPEALYFLGLNHPAQFHRIYQLSN